MAKKTAQEAAWKHFDKQIRRADVDRRKEREQEAAVTRKTCRDGNSF